MDIKKALKKLKNFRAEIAVFCGSGLAGLVGLENREVVSYKSLGFDFANIEGHEREMEFGEFAGKKVVLCSRFHFYEDGSTDNMFNLTKILFAVGVKVIIATTAVGALNEEYDAGDIVLIKDHINMSGTNPFINREPIRFVDLTNAYDKTLRAMAQKVAKSLKIKLWEGVHLQTMGPSYETPAEVKFFRSIGADTVSMSLAHGAICASHLGISFLAFASVTNKAVSEGCEPITHDEVLRISAITTQKLKKIIEKIIPMIE